MSILVQLPPELEAKLGFAAARLGIDVPEYILRILIEQSGNAPAQVRNGSELVTYWKKENLIGTRPDIVDVVAQSRTLREQAQKRTEG